MPCAYENYTKVLYLALIIFEINFKIYQSTYTYALDDISLIKQFEM